MYNRSITFTYLSTQAMTRDAGRILGSEARRLAICIAGLARMGAKTQEA